MPRILVWVPALMVGLAGCGGTATVDRAQVEKEARTELSKSAGQQAPAVKCPEDLKLEVGTKMRCHMDFPDGNRLGLTVAVQSVDGSDGKLSFVADEAPTKTP